MKRHKEKDTLTIKKSLQSLHNGKEREMQKNTTWLTLRFRFIRINFT